MFVAIFIICLLDSGKYTCTSNVGRSSPFYTKKECEMHSKATYASNDFKCIKVGESK